MMESPDALANVQPRSFELLKKSEQAIKKDIQRYFDLLHQKYRYLDERRFESAFSLNQELARKSEWVRDEERNVRSLCRFIIDSMKNYRGTFPEYERQFAKVSRMPLHPIVSADAGSVRNSINAAYKIEQSGMLPDLVSRMGISLGELESETQGYLDLLRRESDPPSVQALCGQDKAEIEALAKILSRLINDIISNSVIAIEEYEKVNGRIQLKLGNPIRDLVIRAAYNSLRGAYEHFGLYKMAYNSLNMLLYPWPDVHYGSSLDPWNAYRDFFMGRPSGNAGSLRIYPQGLYVEVHSHVGGNGLSWYKGEGGQALIGDRWVSSVAEALEFFDQKTAAADYKTKVYSFYVGWDEFRKGNAAFIESLKKEFGKATTIRSGNGDSTLNMMMSSHGGAGLENITRTRLSKLVTLAYATRRKTARGIQTIEERYAEMVRKGEFERYLGIMADENIGVLISNQSSLPTDGLITLPSISPMSRLPSIGIGPLWRKRMVSISVRASSSETAESAFASMKESFGECKPLQSLDWKAIPPYTLY